MLYSRHFPARLQIVSSRFRVVCDGLVDLPHCAIAGISAASCFGCKVDGIRWVVFDDPNEHAFSVDVPKGWRVEGGLVRRNAEDVSDFLRALAPDGSMMLIAGDPGPAIFHTTGFGRTAEDRAYLPGKNYARAYSESILPALCSDAKFVSDKERRDIENSSAIKALAVSHFDAGETVYSCTHKLEPASLYMLAGTWIRKSGALDAADIWGLDLLVGCIGPSAELDRCKGIVQHMLFSAKTSAAWIRGEQERARRAAQDPGSNSTHTSEWEANRRRAATQSIEMNRAYNSPAPSP